MSTLTALQIKSLKPKEQRYRVSDGLGLVLEVAPSGAKVWRYRFRAEGKANMATIGSWPEISLAQAREKRVELRKQVSSGNNPNQQKNTAASNDTPPTFKEAFGQWFAIQQQDWSPKTADRAYRQMHNHILPTLGDRALGSIAPQDVIATLKVIEARGTINNMTKLRNYTSRVFRYAVGMGYTTTDPVRDIPTDIFRRDKAKGYAATVDEDFLRGLLLAIDGYQGSFSVMQALKIAPYVFLRPSELAQLEWQEVDLTNKLIRIPEERMKKGKEHLVPLATQVITVLSECRNYCAHDQRYVFPSSINNRPINAESLRVGLRRMGITKHQLTTHGLRHTASTLLNEQGFRPDAIELQLAHKDSSVRAVYNRSQLLDYRRQMMQDWADYLSGLKEKQHTTTMGKAEEPLPSSL